MKKANWKKLLLDISFWLTAEIVLNLMGIDDLADYSEFLLGQKSSVLTSGSIITFMVIN